ncbi:MAG: hypothetical protein ACFFBP_04595 [Promethearchaeota archaeon]
MLSSNIQNTLKKAIINGNSLMLVDLIRNFIKNNDEEKVNLTSIKEILKFIGNSLRGLTIEGYKGDFPTFIEPVFLTPGIEIGDTVLLGPNVLLGKECKLGDFCELSNTILFNGVSLGKYCKLKWCIVDQYLNLPQKFEAKEAYITKNAKGDIEILYF